MHSLSYEQTDVSSGYRSFKAKEMFAVALTGRESTCRRLKLRALSVKSIHSFRAIEGIQSVPVSDQAKESRVVAKCKAFRGTRDGAKALLAGS